jgi:hypothetical protein
MEPILLHQDIEVFDAVEISVELSNADGEPVSAPHPCVFDLKEREGAGSNVRERSEDLVTPSNAYTRRQSVAQPIRSGSASTHGIRDQAQSGLAVVSTL